MYCAYLGIDYIYQNLVIQKGGIRLSRVALRGFRNTLKRRPRVATVAFDGRYMG